MRLDFREERRWKLALAYNLAHAVMEWHEAGTIEERVRRGICVLWKKPSSEEDAYADVDVDMDRPLEDQDPIDFGPREIEEDNPEDSKENSTPADGYGSDDDSDDEQEKDQQDVLDALEPQAAVQDALETALSGLQSNGVSSRRGQGQDRERSSSVFGNVRPKVEDIEDLSALRGRPEPKDAMQVDPKEGADKQQQQQQLKSEPTDGDAPEGSGLKSTSQNPILGGGQAISTSTKSSSKSKTKSNTYAPLREQIVYSDLDKLFIDLDDLDITKAMAALTTEDPLLSAPPPPTDLSSIFPDLQPYGMLDVAPVSFSSEGGKRRSDRRGDRDDPNKRAEDTTYSKLVPMNEFMFCKPTVLSALEPARHWMDGEWVDMDNVAVNAEFDTPNSRVVDDSVHCSMSFHLSLRFYSCEYADTNLCLSF